MAPRNPSHSTSNGEAASESAIPTKIPMVQMPVKSASSVGPNQSATSVEIEVTIKGTEMAMPIWPASSM